MEHSCLLIIHHTGDVLYGALWWKHWCCTWHSAEVAPAQLRECTWEAQFEQLRTISPPPHLKAADASWLFKMTERGTNQKSLNSQLYQNELLHWQPGSKNFESIPLLCQFFLCQLSSAIWGKRAEKMWVKCAKIAVKENMNSHAHIHLTKIDYSLCN